MKPFPRVRAALLTFVCGAIAAGAADVLGDIAPYYWLVKDGDRWIFKDHAYSAERWQKQVRKMPGLSGPM